MRSSHCARGKDSAGAAYFSEPFGYRACRSILRNPRRYGAAPYKRLSLRETCRQLVEQSGDMRLVGIATTGKMCSALS
jgi:hypothetical protein